MMPSHGPLERILSPEVEATVQTILDTWVPSLQKHILLILPCSAKKPYRTSRSQQLYMRAVYEVKGAEAAVEVVTLSGVFGIVPREFEDLPIVQNYDLSLNRSKHTKGEHAKIISILAWRVGDFLERYGNCYSDILFYGRDRYARVINGANCRGLPVRVRIIGSGSIRLKSSGLVKLKNVLEDKLAPQ